MEKILFVIFLVSLPVNYYRHKHLIMSNSFYPLTLSKIRQETADAVSLFFEVPEELKDKFKFTQGQYLTLRFQINGQEERRAYSMCSSPLEPELAVS